MARFSKPPLASLGRCLVTASVKRRQLGNRVAMLLSFEILLYPMADAFLTCGRQHHIMRYASMVWHGGVKGPIMFHNDYSVNWGEPAFSCSRTSMKYNYKTKEIK